MADMNGEPQTWVVLLCAIGIGTFVSGCIALLDRHYKKASTDPQNTSHVHLTSPQK